MKNKQARFGVIEDPHHPSYVSHILADVLSIMMCAVLCGLDTLGDIVIYAENNKDFLKEKLDIEKIPSKATLARILSMVDGAQVGAVIVELMRERYGTSGEVIAVDGKAICSTAKPEHPRSTLQI